MTQSAYVLAYLDAIKTRDAAFGHLQKMTTRANMLLHVMEDRHSQGVRAFGVSDKNSETPEFPQGPAIYDVADWPTGADFKQAYEDLNAGNEGVFTAWDAIPDVEREGLPQPNVLWPRKPQTREQAAQRRNKDSA